MQVQSTHDVTPAHALFIRKGSWLVNDLNVSIDAKWGGFTNGTGNSGTGSTGLNVGGLFGRD